MDTVHLRGGGWDTCQVTRSTQVYIPEYCCYNTRQSNAKGCSLQSTLVPTLSSERHTLCRMKIPETLSHHSVWYLFSKTMRDTQNSTPVYIYIHLSWVHICINWESDGSSCLSVIIRLYKLLTKANHFLFLFRYVEI